MDQTSNDLHGGIRVVDIRAGQNFWDNGILYLADTDVTVNGSWAAVNAVDDDDVVGVLLLAVGGHVLAISARARAAHDARVAQASALGEA